MLDLFEKGQEYENQGDYVNAFNTYLQAAEKGDVDAQFHVANMYYVGECVDQNYAEALKWYLKAAANGSTAAQYNVAIMYREGNGVEKNYEEAAKWFAKAANNGDVDAQFHLAVLYEEGWGVECNIEEALKWYLKAAEQGDADAQYIVANKYRTGEGLPQNYNEAEAWYIKAADQNHASAQFNLALMYKTGAIGEQHLDKTVEWYTRSANNGHITAMFNLARMYQTGEGVEKNINKAIEWYTIAAEQGDMEAQYNLALIYERESQEADDQLAAKWFLKVADQGYAEAQSKIAYLYYYGKGIEQSYQKAEEWFLKAANQGERTAQRNLAIMYLGQRGIVRNDCESAKWFLEAAKQGDAESQFEIGNCYFKGRGVPQNLEEAAKWYKIAAEQDYSAAENNLGGMYEEGKGVEQNYDLAKYWYEKAAASGHAYGLVNLGQLYEQGLGSDVSPQRAIELWKKACETDPERCAGAKYKLGYAYYDGWGVKCDLEKALEYFVQADSEGYACSYAIDMVGNEIARKENKSSKDLLQNNAMRLYADGIISRKIPIEKMYPHVIKDLKKDFGDAWNSLQVNSQKFLATSVVCYIALYSMGKHIYGNMDFTSSITPMIKALELEIGKYLYTGYINYLNENNIQISTFPSRRSFIKAEGPYSFSYREPDDLSEFTLGSLHLVIGIDKTTQMRNGLVSVGNNNEKSSLKSGTSHPKASIDKSMLDYLKSIFDKDSFGDLDLDRAITDYIVDLSTEIKSITDSFRNPAAHSNVMSCSKAEACANALIKAKKIICKFVEKIKV